MPLLQHAIQHNGQRIEAMLDARDRFLLVPTQLDVNRVAAAFERHCSLLEALQRACNENPRLYAEYLRAFGA